MNEPIVIVGAGPVAAQAVTSLRQLGYDGDIVVIGDEPHPPYQRPPLSKAYLSGEFSLDRLALKGREFYNTAKVDLRIGDAAAAVDAARRTVTTQSGGCVPYTKLLIATGARARPLSGHAGRLAGVHVIRSIADADRLALDLKPGARLTVVGGGYVGLETAAKARSLGVDVHVIEVASRLLQRVVSPEVSAFFEALHASHGVAIAKGRGVAALEGRDRVTAVRMSDGERIATDVVLVAVGSLPNVEFAAGAGLVLDNGAILVDETTAASTPGIHAAGDVTRFPSRLYGRRIRLESVQNATDQAKASAAAMLGQTVFYDPMPWFWSDQYDVKLQIAGLSEGYDTATTMRDGGAGFSVEYFCGNRLFAVDSINAAKSHMLARRRIADAFLATSIQPGLVQPDGTPVA